jgi:hypothetical protein
MKKQFISSILFLIMLVAFVPQTNAQVVFSEKSADLTHYYAKFPPTLIDSVTAVYSEWFTLRGYQADYPYIALTDTSNGLASTWTQSPLRMTYKHTSTLGKPKLKYEVEGTNDPTDTSQHFTIGTISSASDSVETWQKNDAFSFGATKFLWYRIKISGLAANRSDVYAKYEIFFLGTKNK